MRRLLKYETAGRVAHGRNSNKKNWLEPRRRHLNGYLSQYCQQKDKQGPKPFRSSKIHLTKDTGKIGSNQNESIYIHTLPSKHGTKRICM